MAEAKKIQLYTDRECTVEASPETSANCVTLSDGLDVESVLKHDLTAPTVIHEETSFKVGKGDIDVSASVVDGETPKMVIKGQTYQNILPDPSLRNSMSNGKTMQKINEGYDSVNVVDGVGKSAILKGCTLVNIFKNPIFGTVSGNDRIRFITKDKSLFKPNTKYIIFNKTDKEVHLDHNKISDNAYITSYIIYPNSYKILTYGEDEYTYVIRGMYSKGWENTEAHIQQLKECCMIIEYQEGMENWDIPYFEGMQSVRMPVLQTTGKNLFDISQINTTNAIKVSGNAITINSSTPYNITQLKLNNLVVGNTYTLSCEKDSNIEISVRDKNGLARIYWYAESGVLSGKFICDEELLLNISNRDFVNEARTISNIQIEQNTVATAYEPHKSNILSTNEEVELHGIDGVQDTLDLITGVQVQNIIKKVFNGTEVWSFINKEYDTNIAFQTPINDAKSKKLLCDKLPIISSAYSNDEVGISINATFAAIQIRVLKSSLSSLDVDGFKTWLSQNPITVQYELATPAVKTVDLSSFGNWDKVVLDGSGDEYYSHIPTQANLTTGTHLYQFRMSDVLAPDNANVYVISDNKDLPPYSANEVWRNTWDKKGVSFGNGNDLGTLQIRIDAKNVDELRQYLSQNPTTLWYQKTTSKANSIKEMLSFANGHIQLSSGVENSLIPSIDYEVPTSNSYHMDLMKADTNYTVKSTNPNGTCDIGDMKGITIPSNYLWNVPSARKGNMLLVVHGSWTNPMVLEGDLTSKTLPYFKGIKSSFEDESKIEVLSTGKNLFDISKLVKTSNFYAEITENSITLENKNGGNYSAIASSQSISLKKVCKYTVSFNGKILSGNTMPEPYITLRRKTSSGTAYYRDISLSSTPHTFIASADDVVIPHVYSSWSSGGTNKVEYSNITIEETANVKDYEPYKSNVSKIPLLSPLRSLQNGVCDELIIDRMKKKVTLIQRVGKVVLDGSENWTLHSTNSYGIANFSLKFTSKENAFYVCDRFASTGDIISVAKTEGILNGGGVTMYIRMNERRCNNVTLFKKWLSQNPTTVYYELATPIITEIDLEGFPYIYKDGYIFLNSEIAPVVEINCNVNQSQQIQANNETLQRHELDILDLDNLIVSFVNAEYNLRLLKFDMEMSMMALAE